MRRIAYLKKSADFREVYRKRQSKANQLLVLYRRKNDLPISRIGFSVSKKVGNSVIRHRLKRRLREIVRLNEAMTATGYDVVLIVREGARDCDYHELERAYRNLLRRQKLLLAQ